MSFGKFIKQNLALSLGIALPVVLVLGFLAATVIPQKLTAAPKYKFAYTLVDYNRPSPTKKMVVNLTAKEGKIILSLAKSKNDYAPPVPRLMIYDPQTEQSEEINYKLPAGLRGDAEEEQLAETKDLVLSKDNKAPDGYEFQGDSRYYSGIVTELFMGGSYRGARLVKGAATRKAPADIAYGGNTQFLGWIVEDKAE